MQPFARHARLVARGARLTAIDCHAALMDLPRLLGLTLGRIRPMGGILAAEPARLARWRERLAGPGRLVALAFRGGADNPENERRSIDPALLRPLFERDGLRIVSLQKDAPLPHPRALDPASLAAGSGFDARGEAFLDSAAIVSLADCVVTVDTALAHLAGALGRPGYLLLAHVADWRWLTGPGECLWYPSLRIIRQPAPGQWQPVVDRLVQALAAGGARP
jgi:hypothetical protein